MSPSFSRGNYKPPKRAPKTQKPADCPKVARKIADYYLRECRPFSPIWFREFKELSPDSSDQLIRRAAGGGYPNVKNPNGNCGGLGLDVTEKKVKEVKGLDDGRTCKVVSYEFSRENVARCYQYLETYFPEDIVDLVDDGVIEELEEVLGADGDERGAGADED